MFSKWTQNVLLQIVNNLSSNFSVNHTHFYLDFIETGASPSLRGSVCDGLMYVRADLSVCTVLGSVWAKPW